MNKAIIMGRLTRDPELRTLQDNISCATLRLRSIEEDVLRMASARRISFRSYSGVSRRNSYPAISQKDSASPSWDESRCAIMKTPMASDAP